MATFSRALDRSPRSAASRVALRGWSGLLCAVLVWCVVPCPAAQGAEPLPEGPFGELVSGVWGRDLGGGVVLDRMQRGHDIKLTLHYADGRFAGLLALRHPEAPGRKTKSMAVAVRTPFSQVRTPEQQVAQDALATVFREIAARDPGTLDALLPRWERTRWKHERHRLLLGGPLLLLLLLAIWQVLRHRPLFGGTDIRRNHLVPAGIQVVLFSYWALYVSTVRDRGVDLAAQLVFAYILDAVLSFARGRPWRLRLSPLPIVFSTNLFVWFVPPWLQCLAIAIALLSKELLMRRGSHIFNPSAFAISVLALLTLAAPLWFPWHTPTPDVEFNLPPNMAELIVLLAVVAQLRFPIVWIPLAAVAGLRIAGMLHLSPPGPFWPATLLILVLFATDPKTIPKTVPGRALFGLLLGLSIGGIAHGLRLLGEPDVYAKVLPIPFLNLLSPQLDRLGARARAMDMAPVARWFRRNKVAGVFVVVVLVAFIPVGPLIALFFGAVALVRRALRRRNEADSLLRFPWRHNRLHVALWVLVAAFGIASSKERSFQSYDHWKLETPGVTSEIADDFPRCAQNPVWCSSFSVIGEVRLWIRRLGATTKGAAD